MEHQHNHTENTVLHYTCPMHPEIVQDKPGNCPKCGMTLVEMKSTNAEKAADKNDAGVADVAEDTFQKYTCPMHPHIIKDAPGK